MTENEYSHLIFMYHHLGYSEWMSFEEFVNRYEKAMLICKEGDKQ